MTKKKVLYLIVTALIIMTILLMFMFLLPKEQVYTGVLAKGKNMVDHMTQG